MPPPRDASGLSQGAMRVIFTGTYRWLLATALRLKLSPFQLTLLSLITNVIVGVLLLRGMFLAAGLVLIPAGVFDVLDGAVARHRGTASRGGAFLDSFLDRISDLIVFGAITLALAGQGRDLEAGLALVALVVSLGVSHVRAEGEAAGVPLTAGLMQRMERAIAIVVGLLIPGGLVVALAVLAVLGAVTLVQRAWMAVAGAGE
jgi:CDP-diacylglycerol--glycerol-3-phosphate 3-phosphatidyltransferase